MKGYKVFNPDWTCRGFQYEIGKKYEMEETPVICEKGFHFCEKAADCFEYYGFDSNNKVAEIEAYGELDFEKDGDKHCTNKIKIIRELNWHEVLDLVNTGKNCTGLCNSGSRNSGSRNSGDWNSGDWNSGDCNSGSRNSGSRNSGNRNSGNWNSGDCNSGSRNSGNRNSGNRNSGSRNSGDCNSGDCNSGNCNSDSRNSGNCNSGSRNSGNCNSGDCNSGDWNSGSNCTGCFNTISQPLMFFDKPSDITFNQWRKSYAYWLLNRIDFRPTEWIMMSDMTDVEKEKHPEYETTGDYLRNVDNSECCAEWWDGLTEKEKEIIKGIPNFDSEKFYQITGIKVE